MHHVNQLRAVAALAEFRNFSKAADSLAMTQSALSQNVKKLEDHYGVTLFQRQHGRVDVTVFGEIVVRSAVDILATIRVMQKEIALLSNFETGRIAIGVDPYFASSLVAPILANLMAEYPNLKFSLKSGSYAEFELDLHSGAVDLYLGMPPRQVSPGLDCDLLRVPTPLVLCPAKHPLANSKAISLAEALEHRLVTPTPPAWYIDWVSKQLGTQLADRGIEQLMILNADNMSVVKSVALKSNALMAALPQDVSDELADGSLTKLSVKNWPKTMQSCIISSATRPMSPASTLFVEAYTERANALAPS